MKKIKVILALLTIGVVALSSSCSDDNDPNVESIQPATTLYYFYNSVVYAYNLETEEVIEIVSDDEYEGFINSIAVDKKTGKIFIADADNNRILSKKLDGTEELQLLYSKADDGAFVDSPDAISINPDNNEIYWSSTAYGTLTKGAKDGSVDLTFLTDALEFDIFGMTVFEGAIYGATLNGLGKVSLATIEQSEFHNGNLIFGAKIHRTEKMLYWSSQGDDLLAKGDLNGDAEPTTIFDSNDGVTNPFHIAIDEAAGKIYWVEFPGNGALIKRGNIDGTGAPEILLELPNSGNIALDN